MKKECPEIDGLLVDCVDGVLAERQAAEVAEHLKECPACQAKVKALERSLEVTRAIWQDTEKTVAEKVPAEKGVRPRECGSLEARCIPQEKGSDPFFRYAAVAAGIVVVGIAALLWSVQSRPAPTFDQMEDSIAQAADAARILAAADILAGQDGGKQAATEQYQLISESYRNTPSGKEVLSRMKSTERRI